MVGSCAKDSSTFILEMEEFDGQKVHLDDSRYACWDDEDSISVNGNEFCVQVDSRSACIVGVPMSSQYVAVYPSSICNRYFGISYDVELPSVQNYETVDGSQRVKAPMVATVSSGGGVLSFHNIGALLAVNITNDGSEPLNVRTITVRDLNGRYLSGPCTMYDFSSGYPKLRFEQNDGYSGVALYCGNEGVKIPVGSTSTFYISIPEVSSAMLSVTVSDGSKGFYMKRNSSKSYSRNMIYGIPFRVSSAECKGLTSNEFRYTTKDGRPLGFTWKQYEKTDMWGGVLLEDTYEGGVGVMRFDADIKGIPDYAFEDQDRLISVSIPEGVTHVGVGSFVQCNYISEVHLPSTLQRIDIGAFMECDALAELDIPANVTRIEEYAFSGCYIIENVSCHRSSPPSLGDGAFEDLYWSQLHVPAGSEQSYRYSSWNRYFDCYYGIYGDL